MNINVELFANENKVDCTQLASTPTIISNESER